MGKNDRQNRKLKIIVLASFAFISIIWALFPENIVFGSESVCLHYKWFGVQCPFCGLSRAGYSLLHFKLAEAWNYNPLIFYIGWLYALEWATLANTNVVMVIRKFSWWIGLGLVVLIYGIRLF